MSATAPFRFEVWMRCALLGMLAGPGCFLFDDFELSQQPVSPSAQGPVVDEPPNEPGVDVAPEPTTPTLPSTQPGDPTPSPQPTSPVPEDAGQPPPAVSEQDAATSPEAGTTPAEPQPEPDAGGVTSPGGDGPSCEPGYSFDEDLEVCVSDCRADEVRGPNGRCYWFGTLFVPFSSAQMACTMRAPGWTLLTVRDEAEDEFIREHLTGETWIGASDRGHNNRWSWLEDNSDFWSGDESGMPLDDAYTNWAQGEPSASPGEDCARYQGSFGDWSWADCECNELYITACYGPEPVPGVGL